MKAGNRGSAVGRFLIPFGKKVSLVVLVFGATISLYISLQTRFTEGYVSPTDFKHPTLCNSGDIAYDQTGWPYEVRLPDLRGDVLTDPPDPPCLAILAYVHTHLDYWHLLLNGIFWTYLVYGAILAPVIVIKRYALGLRAKRNQPR